MSDAEANIVFSGDFSKIEAQAQASAEKIAASYQKAINSAFSGSKSSAGAGQQTLAGFEQTTAAATKTSKALKETTAAADKATDSAKKTGKAFGDASKQFLGFNSGLNQVGRFLIPISAGLAALAVKSVQAASGVVEAVNAAGVAFGESAAEIRLFSRDLQENKTFFGLTERAALDAAATFGLFLDGLDLSKPLLADFSKQLIVASADVGSLFNINTNKVILDFQAGLAGQTRAVRKYGLDISEATTKQEAYRIGLTEVGQELTEEEKRIARLSLILHGSAIAAGDAEITQNTFAGALRNTQVALGTVIRQVGDNLIPLATVLLKVVGGVSNAFSGLDSFTKRLVISFGGIVAVLGPAVMLGVKLAPMFISAIPAVFGFSAALSTMTFTLATATGGLSLLVAAAGALAFALSGPSALEDTSKAFQQLNTDASGLALTNEELAASFKKLGLEASDLDNFKNFEAAIIAANKAASGGKEGIGDTIKDFFGVVLGGADGVEKSTKVLGLEEEAIKKVINAVKNNQILSAQDFIASTNNLAIRTKLQAVFDKELKSLAERKIRQDAANVAADKAVQLAIDQQNPTERLNKAFEESKKNIEALLTSQSAVVSAEKSLRDSKRSLSEAQQRLNKLDKEGAVDQDAVLQATQALTDATNRKLNADKNVLDVQKQLNEALKLATADQIGAANDKILSSEIALAAAKRERLKAERALIPAVRTNLNLAGKSLDQIRSLLAGERARVAAIAATAGGDAPEDKAEKAITAAIGEREAERNLTEAKADRVALDKVGIEVDEKVIDAREKLRDATVAVAKAEREGVDAANKLTEVRKGDPDFEVNRAQAVQALADAKSNVADAEERLVTAQIKRIADEGTLAGNLEAGNKELAARLLLNRDLIDQQKKSAEFQAQFKALILRSGVIPFVVSPTRIDEIVQSLLNDPNSPFKALFKGAGLPGFAEGTLVRSPVVARLGENFKPEAVMPLTDTNRSVTVLRESLPFMAPELQRFLAPSLDRAAGPGWAAPAGGVGRSDDRLDEMIALLKKIEQHPTGGVNIVMPPEAPMTKRELARAVRRELEGLL